MPHVPAAGDHVVVLLAAGHRRVLVVHQDLLDDEAHGAQVLAVVTGAVGGGPHRVPVDLVHTVNQADLTDSGEPDSDRLPCVITSQ